jgi:hypothetical protein
MGTAMLLGDVIARFEDPAFADEALLAIDDLALTARLAAAAAAEGLTPGEFATQCIGRFVNAASDADWLSLVGLIARADDPGQIFLRRVLSQALAAPAVV